VTSLETNGDTASLSYEIYQPGVEATDQTGDGAVAGLFNIMRTLCGPDWKPAEFQLAHRKPDNFVPFRQFFRATLRFDVEWNAMVSSADWLNLRLP
jgi:hypothetical protein